MIPNIFVSSTIEDLHHLRESVKDTITDLGYSSVLSEHGDVGYLPDMSAVDSCYTAIGDCQLAVFIIGSRYGHVDDSGVSITHNEFRNARERSVPTIALIDRDVLAFKKVYDANRSNPPSFPGMDNPVNTFRFVDEISESELNNGVLAFRSASEARVLIRRQLALIFGDLLTRRFDPLKAQVRDVLSEIKTLRHELISDKDKVQASREYLNALRYLLSDASLPAYYRGLLERTIGDVDEAIPTLLESKTFDEFATKSSITLTLDEGEDFVSEVLRAQMELPTDLLLSSVTKVEGEAGAPGTLVSANLAVFKGRKVRLNGAAKRQLDRAHAELVSWVGQHSN